MYVKPPPQKTSQAPPKSGIIRKDQKMPHRRGFQTATVFRTAFQSETRHSVIGGKPHLLHSEYVKERQHSPCLITFRKNSALNEKLGSFFYINFCVFVVSLWLKVFYAIFNLGSFCNFSFSSEGHD
jgi:hypothetical protein